MTLKEFSYKYRYKLDKNYDDWSIIKPDADGMYYGDCESMVITIKKLVPECKDLEYYFCYLNGIGHCIGIQNQQWIDCNTREFRSLDSMPSSYTGVRKIRWYEFYARRLKGFLLSLFYKDN